MLHIKPQSGWKRSGNEYPSDMFVMSNIDWIYSVTVLMNSWWVSIHYKNQLSWLTLPELLLSVSELLLSVSKSGFKKKGQILSVLVDFPPSVEVEPIIMDLSECDVLGSCFCQWFRRIIVQIFLPFKNSFCFRPGILSIKCPLWLLLHMCRHWVSGEESPRHPATEQCGIAQAGAPALHRNTETVRECPHQPCPGSLVPQNIGCGAFPF